MIEGKEVTDFDLTFRRVINEEGSEIRWYLDAYPIDNWGSRAEFYWKRFTLSSRDVAMIGLQGKHVGKTWGLVGFVTEFPAKIPASLYADLMGLRMEVDLV